MTSTPKDFLMIYRDRLILMVEGFLDGSVSADELEKFVWDILDHWEGLSQKAKAMSYAKGEKVFWAIFWEIMSTSGEELTSSSKEVLQVLLKCLQNMRSLPGGYNARRP